MNPNLLEGGRCPSDDPTLPIPRIDQEGLSLLVERPDGDLPVWRLDLGLIRQTLLAGLQDTPLRRPAVRILDSDERFLNAIHL